MIGGDESVISGGSEREALEPKWDIPSFGVVPESESDHCIFAVRSTEQRVDMWLDDVLREVDDGPVVHELPPIVAVESDNWQHADWEDLDEPSNENLMGTPTPSEIERERELMASRAEDESRPSDGGRSGEIAAEENDDDHFFYVSDDPFPNQAHMISVSLFSGSVSSQTERSHHIGSSTISDDFAKRFAAKEAMIWTNFEAAEKRRETQRERVEIVKGRGSIAGENLAEARHTRMWDRIPFPAPLEVFAEFLDDEDVNDMEYLELKRCFDLAFVLGYNRFTESWPVRPETPPHIANWPRTRVCQPWARDGPMTAVEDEAEEEEESLSSMNSEEEEEWDRIQEEERRSRLMEAYARGRAAGLIEGIAAYRDGEQMWGQDTSDVAPSLDFSRSPLERYSDVDDFVDDHGFLVDDEEEMIQLESFFKRGYDHTFSVASRNIDGFVTSLGVIPSLDEFMEGRVRIFY
jgi:hypothetical protein